MRILYFGTFDPDYGRNWVIINGLRKNGVEVIEMRRKPKRGALVKLFFDCILKHPRFDAMIVGFPGQEVMFLARMLTRKPIIFDAFTSHYGGYILNRKRFSPKSLRAKYFRFLDKYSSKLADVVLLESNAYIDFFVKEYGIDKNKFRRIWIGANTDIFHPSATKRANDGMFNVLFFGTYVPVQGTEYIIRAAKILESENIHFTLCGTGQDFKKTRDLALELNLKNITFHGMLSKDRVREELEKADVSLGNFGGTPLSPLIVSNKVYEALAMAKPVITADMPANHELFEKDDVVMVPVADPKALSDAIMMLKNSPELRKQIADNGYNKFIKCAAPEIIGTEVLKIIKKLS